MLRYDCVTLAYPYTFLSLISSLYCCTPAKKKRKRKKEKEKKKKKKKKKKEKKVRFF